MRKPAAKKKSHPRPQTPVPEPSGITPISARMKELRGRKPTAHQKKVFSEFMDTKSNPRSERALAGAFDNAVEIDGLRDKLKNETDEKERKRINKKLRGLENKITPTARRVAADRNRPLVKAIQRDIKQNGVPSNIADHLDRLRNKGFKIAEDNAPKPANGITARTVRAILDKKFGVGGRPGRKPKVI